MQQPGQMFPVMPSYPPANITTEQIQKYLDENKKLILAILDNQNLGKLAECAQYQAQLQKNLMYLAAIADAQPQTPTMPTQMSPHPAMQQGGFYMQHPQAAVMAQQQQQQQQQQGIFSTPRPPFSNNPHQMQEHQPHPQGQISMRSPVAGPSNGANNETNLGNKQDKPDGRTVPASDGHGNSAAGGDGDEAK